MTDDPPLESRELVADDQCARRMSQAVVRYQLSRPAFLTAIAAEVAVAVVLLGAGARGLGVVVAALAVLLPVLILARRPQLEAALRGRGYRAGSVIRVDHYPDRLVVTSPQASATHHLDDVRDFVPGPHAGVMRLRGSRLLLVLPTEVIPAEVARTLATRRRR